MFQHPSSGHRYLGDTFAQNLAKISKHPMNRATADAKKPAGKGGLGNF